MLFQLHRSQAAAKIARDAESCGISTVAIQALGLLAPAPEPTTAPPSAPAVPEGRWVVGDSVLLGSKPRLEDVGFRVNANVGRQFGASVDRIEGAAAKGVLPRNVVIHLGTNGTVLVSDCRAAVEAAGPERRVFLVTIRVPRSWMAADNKALRACDAAFDPDRVVLVDWAAQSAGKPSWFGRDRVHPTTPGRVAYTRLIDSTVDRFGL